MVDGCRGKPKADVKVELLIGRDLNRRAQMQEMLKKKSAWGRGKPRPASEGRARQPLTSDKNKIPHENDVALTA
jgi:hypothetical protein